MDAYLIFALGNLLEGDGIVVVLGICRVDGEGKGVAHVAAAKNLVVGNVLGSINLYVGIGVRQPIFGKDPVHLGVVLAIRPEHVQHSPFGHMALGTMVEQFDYHFVAFSGVPDVVRRDDNVVLEQFAVRIDDASASHKLEASHEGVGHSKTGLFRVLFAFTVLFLLFLQSLCSDSLQSGPFALVCFTFFLPAQGTEIGFFHRYETANFSGCLIASST